MVGEASFKLLAVGVEVLIDLGLGHGDPEPHLPVDHARHTHLFTEPLLDRVDGDALGLEAPLELLASRGAQLFDPLRQLLLDLGLIHRDLLALCLLDLEPFLDHLGEKLLDELVRHRRLLARLGPVIVDGLLELAQRNRVVVHDGDDAVGHILVRGLRGSPRLRRPLLLRRLSPAWRGGGRLRRGSVLRPADAWHRRRRRAAAEREGQQSGRCEPPDHDWSRLSRRRSREPRTRAHSPRSTTASIVNSRFILSRPQLPSIARTSRRGSRGVPGANETNATPSPASSFSTPSRRAATRKWTMSRSCSASSGSGPNRSTSSPRRSSTSGSLTAPASRL